MMTAPYADLDFKMLNKLSCALVVLLLIVACTEKRNDQPNEKAMPEINKIKPYSPINTDQALDIKEYKTKNAQAVVEWLKSEKPDSPVYKEIDKFMSDKERDIILNENKAIGNKYYESKLMPMNLNCTKKFDPNSGIIEIDIIKGFHVLAFSDNISSGSHLTPYFLKLQYEEKSSQYNAKNAYDAQVIINKIEQISYNVGLKTLPKQNNFVKSTNSRFKSDELSSDLSTSNASISFNENKHYGIAKDGLKTIKYFVTYSSTSEIARKIMDDIECIGIFKTSSPFYGFMLTDTDNKTATFTDPFEIKSKGYGFNGDIVNFTIFNKNSNKIYDSYDYQR